MFLHVYFILTTSLLILGAVLLVVVTVIVVVAVMGKKGSNGENKTSEQINSEVLDRGFVEEDNAETIVSGIKEQVEEGMFECMMTTEWTFLTGDAESANAYVANSPNNRYTFYFDVYIEDTEEVVYSSPLIPVGSEIKNIKLDKDLEAGAYSMIVNYTMVDENYNEVSDVGFRVKVDVLR